MTFAVCLASTAVRWFVVAMAAAVEHEGHKPTTDREREDDAEYHGDVPVQLSSRHKSPTHRVAARSARSTKTRKTLFIEKVPLPCYNAAIRGPVSPNRSINAWCRLDHLPDNAPRMQSQLGCIRSGGLRAAMHGGTDAAHDFQKDRRQEHPAKAQPSLLKSRRACSSSMDQSSSGLARSWRVILLVFVRPARPTSTLRNLQKIFWTIGFCELPTGYPRQSPLPFLVSIMTRLQSPSTANYAMHAHFGWLRDRQLVA
jgi:hypothetical protein